MEREGEAGERAGKKKKRSGGSRRRGYTNKKTKRGELGSQEEAPTLSLSRYRVKPCAAQGGVADERL
jgi:hypothetical protein